MVDHGDLEYADDLPSSSKWVKANFVLGEELGSGSFGRVFTVQCRRKPETFYAIKEISQASSPKFIATELRIMKSLGGSHNIMNVHAAFRERDRVFLVMDYFPHDNLSTLLCRMSIREKIDYMKNLLIALDYLHRNRLIHRDVKPANFLYDSKRKRYALIDFGLSHAYRPNRHATRSPPSGSSSKENSSLVPPSPRKRSSRYLLSGNNSKDEPDEKRAKTSCHCFGTAYKCDICMSKPLKKVNKAGTPGFRAPEVLLKFDDKYQTPAVDIWSAGITFMALLFRRHPIFRPSDDYEAICQICQLMGSDRVVEAARKCGVNVMISPKFPGVDLVKMMKCVRIGLDSAAFDGPADRCETCSKLIFKNSKGRCICKNGQIASIEALPNEERLCVEVMMRCLNVDPITRSTAGVLLSTIQDMGY